MIKSIPQNAVLVELEKISDDEYQMASGVKLFINTSYRPEYHQRIYGKCVAVPRTLTRDGGMIKYEEGDYRYLDSIVPEVMIGDTVYFNYISVDKRNLLEYEGRSYYKIDYSAILCVVRSQPEGFEVDVDEVMAYCKSSEQAFDGVLENILNGSLIMPSHKKMPVSTNIIPIGGNIICEEYYGKDAESVDVDGRKVFGEVSQSGIITKIIKKASQKHAVVKVVGTPLRGDNMEIALGDVIMFPNKFGFKNNIEGTDYLLLKYWDIQAVVGNVNTESLV